MTRAHRFAIASREELWLLASGERVETRLIHGQLEERDGRIDADDRGDADLISRADRLLDALRAAVPRAGSGTLKLVVSARRVGQTVAEAAHAVLTISGLSIVTDARHAASDAKWLRSLAARASEETVSDYHGLPMLWRRGSASVLLHEAAGHAAERRQPPVRWPAWLRVADVPDPVDDAGLRPAPVDLLAGEAPRSMRRQSFVHAASPRMSNLVVSQENAPLTLPKTRIDIHLLGGGLYEPLTETVTLFVAAADLVDEDGVTRVAPFTIEETREAVARSICGARGHSQRYPGVICSSEGQELFVGSAAPDVLTVF